MCACVGQAIEAATKTFLEVASELSARTKDRLLEEALKGACGRVQEGVSIMLAAVKSKSHQTLIKGVMCILEATSSTLGAYDDAQIRRVIDATQAAAGKAKAVCKCKDEDALTHALVECADANDYLVQAARLREPELLNPQLKYRLNIAVRDVENAARLLDSASRSALHAPNDASVSAALKSTINQLADAYAEIASVVRASPGVQNADKEAGSLYLLMEELGRRLLGLAKTVQSKDAAGATDLIDHFDKRAGELLQISEQVVSDCTDPYLAGRVRNDAKALTDSAQAVHEMVITAAANPASVGEVEVAERTSKTVMSLSNLDQSIGVALDAGITDSLEKVISDLASLSDAAQAKDRTQFSSKAQAVRDGVKQVAKRARLRAAQAADADMQERIVHAAERIERQVAAIITAGEAVISSGATPQAVQHMANVVSAWRHNATDLESNVAQIQPTDAALSSLREQTVGAMQRLDTCVGTDDMHGALTAAHDVETRGARAAAQLREEASNRAPSDPTFHQSLVGYADRLDKQVARVRAMMSKQGSVHRVVKQPAKAGSSVAELKELAEAANAVSQEIGRAATEVATETAARDGDSNDAVAMADQLRALQLSPEVPAGAEAAAAPRAVEEGGGGGGAMPSDPIEQAAHTLRAAVDKWESRDNAVVAQASAVASHFSDMKTCVQSNNKSGLIAACRNLSHDAEHLVKNARELAAQQSDLRARKQLLDMAESIPMLCTQLRVICAVKSTSGEAASDAAEQIGINAQNLSAAVQRLIRVMEAVSLRGRGVLRAVAAAAKWRRRALRS